VTWLSALLWTSAVEVPIVASLAALRRWAPGRLGLVALAAVGANFLTQPLAWLADGALAASVPSPPRFALLEAAVTGVEAAVYVVALRLAPRRALAASLFSNAASFAAGLVLQALAR
jgi:hypothetical protein